MACPNTIEEELLKMYKRIGMGNCPTCSSCHNKIKNLSSPVTAWGVGNNFYNEHKKILFVGKTARGYFENPERGYFHKAFDDGRWLWENVGWAYWNYTREITGKIFGDDSFEHIAFTNIVKCNNSAGEDTTTDFVKENCIRQMRILAEEIKIIRPTHIIFYTGWYYDTYIPQAFDTFKILFDGRKIIGAKNVSWRECTSTLADLEICVLRTGHPQYLNKDEFTNAVCEWIKSN